MNLASKSIFYLKQGYQSVKDNNDKLMNFWIHLNICIAMSAGIKKWKHAGQNMIRWLQPSKGYMKLSAISWSGVIHRNTSWAMVIASKILRFFIPIIKSVYQVVFQVPSLIAIEFNSNPEHFMGQIFLTFTIFCLVLPIESRKQIRIWDLSIYRRSYFWKNIWGWRQCSIWPLQAWLRVPGKRKNYEGCG